MVETPYLKIKIQLYCGDEIAMGPGKADLLDAIQSEGSISAAGRAMGMSYRRTWMLVDTAFSRFATSHFNRCNLPGSCRASQSHAPHAAARTLIRD
jgi:hypothetical protein